MWRPRRRDTGREKEAAPRSGSSWTSCASLVMPVRFRLAPAYANITPPDAASSVTEYLLQRNARRTRNECAHIAARRWTLRAIAVRGRSSVVERQLPKLYVVGSIPIARSSPPRRFARYGLGKAVFASGNLTREKGGR